MAKETSTMANRGEYRSLWSVTRKAIWYYLTHPACSDRRGWDVIKEKRREASDVS